MEKKQQNNKDHSPISRNDFLTLFGLMLFDDEARKRRAEMAEEEDEEEDISVMDEYDNDDFDDDLGDDLDDDHDEDEND